MKSLLTTIACCVFSVYVYSQEVNNKNIIGKWTTIPDSTFGAELTYTFINDSEVNYTLPHSPIFKTTYTFDTSQQLFKVLLLNVRHADGSPAIGYDLVKLIKSDELKVQFAEENNLKWDNKETLQNTLTFIKVKK